MRACTTANTIALGLILAVVTFAACGGSNSSTQSSQPTGMSSAAPDEKSPSEQAAPGDTGAAQAPDAKGAVAAKTAPKEPETAADCKELKSEIVNEPPSSAVPMNNATAPSDSAPASDRLAPITALVRSNRDKFRCCFDLWGRKNPGGAGNVNMKVKIDPEGKLLNAEIVPKDTTVTAPEVHACILEVAKSLAWPKSPSGKDTTYTHPFSFKAHH